MELAELHLVEVDLDDRVAGVDAGVVGERGAEHEQQVGLVHHPARDRRAAAAEHARGQRVVVADLALGLERGDHRRAELLGQRGHRRHVVARAVADDDHRPLRAAQQLAARRSIDSSGGEIVERRHAAGGAARRGALGRRQRLHLVGEDQVRDVAPQQRVLAREVHQLDRVGVVQNGLAPARRPRRTRRAGRPPGTRPGPSTCVSTWPVSASTGARSTFASHSPVSRLVAPGPAIVRQAGGPAGELAVGGGGERGGALVADADVGELAGLLLAAQRVGEAEVGVPDHAEDVLDAPVDHRLGHQVGDGRDVRAPPARRRTPRRRGSRAGRWSPRRRSRATCRRAGSSRTRATGSAAARSRSSPRRAGRPGAGSGCRARRTCPS